MYPYDSEGHSDIRYVYIVVYLVRIPVTEPLTKGHQTQNLSEIRAPRIVNHRVTRSLRLYATATLLSQESTRSGRSGVVAPTEGP